MIKLSTNQLMQIFLERYKSVDRINYDISETLYTI
jgi:hypothetical protein